MSFFSGRQGKFTGSSGLQIAYLSGLDGSGSKGDDCSFTATEARSLTAPVANDPGFKGVDILITSQWPKNVEKFGTASVSVKSVFIVSFGIDGCYICLFFINFLICRTICA